MQKKPRRTYFSVNFGEFLGTPFLLNSSGLLLQTLHVYEVEENVSRYCNKEIKVILIEAILVTVCHLWKWFCMLKNLWNPPSRKPTKISEIYSSFVIVKPFFCVILLMILKLLILRNFILKLYLRFWSLLNLNCTHCILISVWPNFLYSNHLSNFSDIFHYIPKNPKTELIYKAGSNYLFIHDNDYEIF